MPQTRVSDTVIQTSATDFFSRDESVSVGALEFRVKGGPITDNATWTTIADTTVTLADDDTNVICIDLSNFTIVEEGSIADSAPRMALYQVTTVSGAITVVTDLRSMLLDRDLAFMEDFETIVSEVGSPDIRFKLDEASGVVFDTGSYSPGSITVSGTPTYRVDGLDTGTGGNVYGINFDGSAQKASGGSYGGQADGTGTLFLLFKPDTLPASSGRDCVFSIGAFSVDGLAVEFDSTGKVRIVTYDGTASSNDITLFRPPIGSEGGANIVAGEWNTITLVKTIATATSSDRLRDIYNVYVNGLKVDSLDGARDFIGNSSNRDTWFDTLNITRDISIANNIIESSGVDNFDGTISEILYWGGVQVTDIQASSLHESLGLTSATSGTPATNALDLTLSERSGVTYKMDDTAGPLSSSSTSLMADVPENGNPTYEQSTFLTGVEGITLDGTGDYFRSSVNSTVFSAPNGGHAIFHFKATGSGAELWNQTASASTGQSTRVQLQSGGLRILSIINGTSANALHFQVDAGNLRDNAWHQVIIHQPADGTGYKFYVDGVKYDNTHMDVTETTFGTGTVDEFINSSSSEQRIGVGHLAISSTTEMDATLTRFRFSSIPTDMDDDYASRLWTATGL